MNYLAVSVRPHDGRWQVFVSGAAALTLFFLHGLSVEALRDVQGFKLVIRILHLVRFLGLPRCKAKNPIFG